MQLSVKQDKLSNPKFNSCKSTIKSGNNYDAKRQARMISRFTKIHKATINKSKSKQDHIQVIDV